MCQLDPFELTCKKIFLTSSPTWCSTTNLASSSTFKNVSMKLGSALASLPVPTDSALALLALITSGVGTVSGGKASARYRKRAYPAGGVDEFGMTVGAAGS